MDKGPFKCFAFIADRTTNLCTFKSIGITFIQLRIILEYTIKAKPDRLARSTAGGLSVDSRDWSCWWFLICISSFERSALNPA